MKIIGYIIVFCFLLSCKQNQENQNASNTESLYTIENISPNYKQVGYYEGGQIKFIQEYYNGIKHGIYKNWYPNGSIRTLGTFHLGIRKGIWSWYNEKGKLEFQVNYDNQLASM